jgi:hypothetical protein
VTDREALEVLGLPALKSVARALLEMTRGKRWGHVTIRFEDGAIRQVDRLETDRIEQPPARRAA